MRDLLHLLAAAALLPAAAVAQNTTAQIVASLADYGINATDYFPPSAFSSSTSTRSVNFCSQLCGNALAHLFSSQTILSSNAAYATWESNFWSQQQEAVNPACILQPTNALEVSIALLLSRLAQCPFAVKSGGHAAFAGSSSIQDGLTIDLALMNTQSLSSDKSVASLGPGNRWHDVYSWLDPQGLSVIGGRVSDIGVGGLTLGGGISFFSGNYGWACDNVNNYEVVLANGSIIDVSQSTHPDLYWALRGGGNNFGIVTRFDLSTHEQGLMWGGSRAWLESSQSDLLQAFVTYGENAPSDPDAALILSVAYAEGMYLFVADLEYSQPVEEPAIFSAFNNQSAIEDTMAIRSLTNITELFKEVNPSGLRESYWTATTQLDINLVTNMTNMFKEELVPVQNATGIVPALVLQVVPTNTLEHMTKNGGNALGLSASDGPLVLINLSFMWEDASDDAAIMQVLQTMTNKILSAANAMGLSSDYLYMNYASQYQAVVPSYGAANQAKLKAISKEFDPQQVFQTLQPGYFKLVGSPSTPLF